MSTLANARDVLRLLSAQGRDLTVTDVCNELELPKSSASRTLGMMAELGFLERNPVTRAYRPGPLVMEASLHYRGTQNVVSLFEHELDGLIELLGYTGYISMLVDRESLIIHMRTGPAGTLQAYTPVGTKAPSYASSMGRAVLARLLPEEVLARIGESLTPYGEGPKTHAEVDERLTAVRERGWELSRGEVLSGVAGFASAVSDPGTGQTFAIGLAVPADDLTSDLIDECGTAIRRSAMRVGRIVGDSYWLDFVE